MFHPLYQMASGRSRFLWWMLGALLLLLGFGLGCWTHKNTTLGLFFSKEQHCLKPSGVNPRVSPEHVLDILAYNVFMRPRWLFNDGQIPRTLRLPERIQGFDVLVLSEAFDTRARHYLLSKLRCIYPHQTSVLGRGHVWKINGGVVVLSRWPIVQKKQIFFSNCSGTDCLSDKGVLYVKLLKGKRYIHLFATHLQAWDMLESRSTRKKQFNSLGDFIQKQSIPAFEPVLIVGDLNVDKYARSSEYKDALKSLQAGNPRQRGAQVFSMDTKRNGLVWSGKTELLDYVLFSKRHLLPKDAWFEVLPLRSVKSWRRGFGNVSESFDLSDHFPVKGHFVFPKRTTDK